MSQYLIEAVINSVISTEDKGKICFSVRGTGTKDLNCYLKRKEHEFNVFWPIEDGMQKLTKLAPKKQRLPELKPVDFMIEAGPLAHLVMNLCQSRSKVHLVVTFKKPVTRKKSDKPAKPSPQEDLIELKKISLVD